MNRKPSPDGLGQRECGVKRAPTPIPLKVWKPVGCILRQELERIRPREAMIQKRYRIEDSFGLAQQHAVPIESAPPVDGAANAALVRFLADALSLRRADVAILSGETARLKMVRLTGDGPALAARLDALLRS